VSEHSQPPGAARIRKGPISVLVLSEEDVRAALDGRALLDALADGFAAVERGEVQSPPRPEITVPGKGFVLSMPSYRAGGLIGVKQVSVFDGNLAHGLPNHLALITLYEPESGKAVCVMDGTHITAVRTAGAAIVSADRLARTDARVATIVGAGVQGREHLALLPLVRDLDTIQIASLHPEDATDLAALDERAVAVRDLAAAVRDSDIVCLASHSAEPVIDAAWVRPGTHVTSVGYAPPAGELPRALAQAPARLFVEDACAFEPPPVGCSELAGLDPSTATALGAVIAGSAPGRRSREDVTVYKAMGIAIEDLVAAELAYCTAVTRGLGQTVAL
jgi:ornithine cyclodeaminase/alanine dehydrogenase-like protein (mu-crystallin family)